MDSESIFESLQEKEIETLMTSIECDLLYYLNTLSQLLLIPLEQSGTISITTPVPVGYLCENAVGHKYFRWKKPPSTYKPIPLYTKEKK